MTYAKTIGSRNPGRQTDRGVPDVYLRDWLLHRAAHSRADKHRSEYPRERSEPTAVERNHSRHYQQQNPDRRRSPPRSPGQSETASGDQLLSWHPSPSRLACARPANIDKRPHPQRSAQNSRRHPEYRSESWESLTMPEEQKSTTPKA